MAASINRVTNTSTDVAFYFAKLTWEDQPSGLYGVALIFSGRDTATHVWHSLVGGPVDGNSPAKISFLRSKIREDWSFELRTFGEQSVNLAIANIGSGASRLIRALKTSQMYLPLLLGYNLDAVNLLNNGEVALFARTIYVDNRPIYSEMSQASSSEFNYSTPDITLIPTSRWV